MIFGDLSILIIHFEFLSVINFHRLLLTIQYLQNFRDTHTDRQVFSKNGQIVFKTLKTCKCFKNLKSKIFANPMLSSCVHRRK